MLWEHKPRASVSTAFSSIRLHIKLLHHFPLPGFLDFFRFSHFLAFSITVVGIFVKIIALLDNGNAVAILH